MATNIKKIPTPTESVEDKLFKLSKQFPNNEVSWRAGRVFQSKKMVDGMHLHLLIYQ